MVRIERPIFRCDSCNKIISENMKEEKTGVTVLEHLYGHEHHLCGSVCLGNWSKGCATK